jgi:hypothetical protein
MKFLFLAAVHTLALSAFAGNGVKGGQPMKDRYLLALKTAIAVTQSKRCSSVFSTEECLKMNRKLTATQNRKFIATQVDECIGQKICWYNEDSEQPQPPLRPILGGKVIDALLVTTEEIESPIIVDVLRSTEIKVTPYEAVIVILHEAGHGIGLSDSLETDRRFISLLGPTEAQLSIKFTILGRDDFRFRADSDLERFDVAIVKLEPVRSIDAPWNRLAAAMYDDSAIVAINGRGKGQLIVGPSLGSLGYSYLTSSGVVAQKFAPLDEKTYGELFLFLKAANDECRVHLVFDRARIELLEVRTKCDPYQ